MSINCLSRVFLLALCVFSFGLHAADTVIHSPEEYKVKGVDTFTPEHPLTLWYRQPATATGVANVWMEYSLPIGNGQLGACLFGGVCRDEIQFNEKTLWDGTPYDMGRYGSYKNFGSVFVRDLSGVFGHTDDKAVNDYVRFLDIESGVAGVDFTSPDGKTRFSRRYLASAPDSAIVVRYTAEGKDDLHLLFSLTPGDDLNAGKATYSDMGEASIAGKLTYLNHAARFRIVPSGRKAVLKKTDEGIEVSGTKEVMLVLSAVTNYNSDVKSMKGSPVMLTIDLKKRVDNVASKDWDSIAYRHQQDFEYFAGRVRLQLGQAASALPTDELVNFYNDKQRNVTGMEPEALFLEQLYFAYGRYLCISCSRGVDVPSNLQGIWNDRSFAPWNSDIHTNINVQMNYWPAENTNLSETHLCFLNFIIKMANGDNWKRCANKYGNVPTGWTCLTESNIFGGMSTWGSNYLVANAWYCSHLWQHYRYTLDREFLALSFPVMWSCAEFWISRMIEDRGYPALSIAPDGTFVAPDEFSPEQQDHNNEDGTAHAQQLIYSLLKYVRQSADILGSGTTGLTDSQLERLDHFLRHTDQGLHTEVYTANMEADSNWTNPRNGVSKGDTILREWKYSTYDVSHDVNHRHMSHLMALYPLNEISPSSPYFIPAVNSLRLRGDEATGWSMGWKVNLWARAQDGDHAHRIMHNALRHSTSYDVDEHAGGIYYNLFDSHAPFQIDGNFGVCAGVAEMLLQSYTDTLCLLPALPAVWKDGSVSGLKAIGNFEVGMQWTDSRLTRAVVKSCSGIQCAVSYPGISVSKVTDSNGTSVRYTVKDSRTIVFPTVKGETYNIIM